MVHPPPAQDGLDSSSILRCLRERYEIHHGVRIKDAALVAAAHLSISYITDRFLPDKAIDRIDEVLILHRLNLPRIKQIVEIQLGQLRQRLADRNIDLTVTERTKEFLDRQGYDPLLDARPLKRVPQRLAQDPMARGISEGDFTEGDRVKVEVQGGEPVAGLRAPPQPAKGGFQGRPPGSSAGHRLSGWKGTAGRQSAEEVGRAFCTALKS